MGTPGLVVSRQEGKWTHYRLSRAGQEKAVKLLLALTTPCEEGTERCNSCEKGTPS